MPRWPRRYMDYAATTPIDPRVGAVMRRAEHAFGNPSSIHKAGVVAKKLLDQSRAVLARAIEAHADEVVFTSGGTEANNLAIVGVLRALEKKGKELSALHVVTTEVEHASVLEPLRALSPALRVTYLRPRSDGTFSPQDVLAALQDDTVLVSIQYANNETGVVQPIVQIARALREYKKTRTASPLFFHVDASQAPLYLRVSQSHLLADLMTFDAHKMYGPKGVGLLYVRRGTPLQPLFHGGGQERGARATTENVPAIAGFARAFEIAVALRDKESKRLAALRDYFFKELKRLFPTAVIHGSQTARLPNNVNVGFPGLDAEYAVLRLDVYGFACSTKSSCLRDEHSSYVLEALGASTASSALRFTFGRGTTKREIQDLITCLARIVRVSR